ncbi:hypothetical protein [uncultured Shewanella sp.]|uniref:hypothetical protein n=1 Tax=uncultured Shewanella sp. TaxID=173975 RepID=UPI00260FE9A6|nr:hypothetical protein [uncultured Shewanella sp.]
MNEFNQFFSQAYLWLSILGGLNCLTACIYINLNHQPRSFNSHLLAGILGLLAVYFFTGAINEHNAPIPINMLFTLIIPIYFLLMPLVYLYCKSNVTIKSINHLNWKHFYPAILVAILVVLVFAYHWFILLHSSNLFFQTIWTPQEFNMIFMVFPGLLSLQAAFYFILIFNLLNKFPFKKDALQNPELTQIKFKWLLLLTFALIMNWLVRCLLIMLPFYTGDTINLFNLLLSRVILLISLYILAFYGLKQVTHIAHIKKQKMSSIQPPPSSNTVKDNLLTDEELDFLQQVMNENK